MHISRKIIISDDELLIDYDYRKIRSKPFYKIKDGVYRVISRLFLVELVYKGIYFKIAEIFKAIKGAQTKENFRSFYGLEFSERFLLYKLLNSIYKNKYIEYSGKDISEIKPKIDGEPDYYIRNGNNLFLYESKDVLIDAKIKQSYDYKLYEQEFKNRFYYIEKQGR